LPVRWPSGSRASGQVSGDDHRRELSTFVGRAFDAQDLLERAAFVPESEPTALAGAARVVAAAPRPLRPAEI
jgi:hypothetical protein